MPWVLSLAGVVGVLAFLSLTGDLSDNAKPIATALTALGAAIAIWATYKAAEEWDDPAKPGRERLTSWGKFAIVLLLAAGVLATYADIRGEPSVARLRMDYDSLRNASDTLLAEVRQLRAELHRSALRDAAAGAIERQQPTPSSSRPAAQRSPNR
jgi:hypothetical protein